MVNFPGYRRGYIREVAMIVKHGDTNALDSVLGKRICLFLKTVTGARSGQQKKAECHKGAHDLSYQTFRRIDKGFSPCPARSLLINMKE